METESEKAERRKRLEKYQQWAGLQEIPVNKLKYH